MWQRCGVEKRVCFHKSKHFLNYIDFLGNFTVKKRMKIQLESIQSSNESSFHLMRNPRLNNFFFWHFHPEFELVFINGANGTRHVGEHIARFEGSDLVFIGGNIPHLNFDFGIKTDYEKTVLHIQPDFLGEAFVKTPELFDIQKLVEKSARGIAFLGETKAKAGKMLQKLHDLPPFEQFLEVLNILNFLAKSSETELLHDAPVKNQYNKKAQQRLQILYRFIDENYQRKIEISEIALVSHMSEAAFCRYFKKMTRLTFTDFLNNYRISQAKRLLLLDKNVSETCYECGFESLSYFNRIFKKITLENPLAFKKRYFLEE
jgi:AraC-like DNA-binding protein